MKSYTHESNKLNALLGKKVRITFFDGDIAEGTLQRDMYRINHYHVEGKDSITFRKSHVKKIEVEE